MTGWLTNCAVEKFGSDVQALGDINHDAIADFAVEHTRCDTMVGGQRPVEWYVYKGIRGVLPSAQSGQRIGPGELASETHILCAGDWDGDGNQDLLAVLHVFNGPRHVCVFWGTNSGTFSIGDTSRLQAISDHWLGAFRAVSTDLDGDHIADLTVWGGGGIVDGNAVNTASIHIYRGHSGGRWGRNGISRRPDLAWWQPPPFNYLQVTDQDCDGHPDIALINQTGSTAYTYVSVLYGRSGMLPDTGSTETIYLEPSNGHYSLFMDVTGDRVPELVTNCGSQEVFKIYAGKPGQRLKAMYGTGNEPSPPFPGKPWLTVALPAKVDPDDWFDTGFSPLYDLGDLNLDGIPDVCTYTFGFFICYETGGVFDYLIDAGMRWGNVTSATRLGDIDGSGVATFAVGWDAAPGGLAFYKATDSIPPTGDGVDLPHPDHFVCSQEAGVSDGPRNGRRGGSTTAYETSDRNTITVDVRPNPARAELLVGWADPSMPHGDATISLVDASGREVFRRLNTPGANQVVIATGRLLRGTYLLIIHIGTRSTATKVVLQ
ncbi:MAG TPA: FG-GAP-like repeat-containing protein [Candidatus Kapabacteria bacterium]|nr:FG-GAP-like repeat-containing protein [Candidatus Kapabacteria bacterium]